MKKTTKLDTLYSLRDEFSIIGITGRTGSGCTEVAEIFSRKFNELNDIVKPKKATTIQERKYEIVYNFSKNNWISYRIIKYRRILLLLMIQNSDIKSFKNHLESYFKFYLKDEIKTEKISKVLLDLVTIFKSNSEIITKAKELGTISKIKTRIKLKELADFFWNEFQDFSVSVDEVLSNNGLIERMNLLHHTASNYRKSGQQYKTEIEDYNSIYFIAETINKIIKGTKILDGKKGCHVVIDSLRNSLEINFFRERYSGFYLIAVKSDERKKRLLAQYNEDEVVVDRMLELDEVEYKCNDFVKGKFFAPDVQNCIQKADYHILTQEENQEKNDFFSVSQQIMKLQGLIQQPGLITPDTIERCMQFAYNAKLSSGCISRQVGAVITDIDFSIKSVGWNDVPRGTVPCSSRNIKELGKKGAFGFSQFELGRGLSEKNEKNVNPDNMEIDKESKDFHNFIKNEYNESTLKKSDLGGINCPYCFKTAYNKYKGETNQVHTRSLHAEENAMMQISKYGGQPLNKGYLFTTASPCELCAKKAYQLGITNIYFVDPYPGISRSHILKQGINPTSDPKLFMFSGAIGRGYFKLYEPFLAQKDEISILTSVKVETPQKVKANQLKDILASKIRDNEKLKNKLDKLFENDNNVFDKVVELIEKSLSDDEGIS
jgi:dCMP deaminase